MNYGEELAYWYLRLNGFFPVSNFVIHRTEETQYPSDADVLAIRPPFVYEDIGGQAEDWDTNLFRHFSADRTIGIICEVKTGAFDIDKLFQRRYVKASTQRLGFTVNVDEHLDQLERNSVTTLANNYQIGKLFISNIPPTNHDNFLYFPIGYIRTFLINRIRKYPKEKYGDRLFFSSSVYFQELIDRTVFELGQE